MFQVVQPLALFALGALAVPIVIHLRRRPLPVVRVGSLRPFLAHQRPSRARTLHNWPIFLLRCALLAALSLALASLQWTPRTPSPTRWCLLLPGTPLQDVHLEDWTLRLREGFEPRWLAPGFPRITNPTNSPVPSVRAPVWSLLSEPDQRLAAGSEAWVFGPTWTSLFEGRRPSVANLRVQWHAVPTSPPILPQPSAHRVGIVHSPDRILDAGYVRAALQAIGASIVSNEVPSWIFQLGAAPLPLTKEELERHRVRIVRDAPEAAETQIVSRRIDVGSQTVTLRQRVAPRPGVPVFRDSQGDPWLTEERHGSVVAWHVAFRFHPDWTDWPLEGAFPAWWQEHLQPLLPNTTAIAPEQAAPRFVPDPTRESASALQRPAPRDLRARCWLLGAALFFIERLLSRLPTPSPGTAHLPSDAS
jgi:Aerotolerance regulator N-terminal